MNFIPASKMGNPNSTPLERNTAHQNQAHYRQRTPTVAPSMLAFSFFATTSVMDYKKSKKQNERKLQTPSVFETQYMMASV
jgi:hypothetical protein